MKVIGLIAIIVVSIHFAILLYKKTKNAEKLEYELANLDFPNLTVTKLLEFVKIRRGDEKAPRLHLKVTERIINPSASKFTIDSIRIDILTLSGNKIIEQVNKLKEPFVIKPKFKNNLLELDLLLDGKALGKLIQESGGEEQIVLNYGLTGDFGITFRLVGHLKTFGVTIDLDEQITI